MSRVFSILLDCGFFLCGALEKVVLIRWHSFAPLLQKKGTIEDPSRVIITASVAGIGVGTLGKNATFGYSASKAAVIHLTKNLAVELGPRHILVNAIAPGFL
jgi:NAD(P)-dependent dehydrogenase (short-subunit alcohol dehydrogenase family)